MLLDVARTGRIAFITDRQPCMVSTLSTRITQFNYSDDATGRSVMNVTRPVLATSSSIITVVKRRDVGAQRSHHARLTVCYERYLTGPIYDEQTQGDPNGQSSRSLPTKRHQHVAKYAVCVSVTMDIVSKGLNISFNLSIFQSHDIPM